MGASNSSELAYSTGNDIINKYKSNLLGKNVFITGSTAGIGKETARSLYLAGATVFVGCRNEEKASALIEELTSPEAIDGASLIPVIMDHGSMDSVKTGISQLKENERFKTRGLDYLILNAGLFYRDKVLTQDNFESHFGVNHLSHFFITKLLLPDLKRQPIKTTYSPWETAKEEARVVVVSSQGHTRAELDLEDVNYENRPLPPRVGYFNSKAYNVLFSNYLNSILEKEYENELQTNHVQSDEDLSFDPYKKPVRVTSNSLHPGIISTDITRNAYLMSIYIYMRSDKTVEQGASTTVFAVVSPELKGVGGKYLMDCEIKEPTQEVQDIEKQKKLWELSEKYIEPWI